MSSRTFEYMLSAVCGAAGRGAVGGGGRRGNGRRERAARAAARSGGGAAATPRRGALLGSYSPGQRASASRPAAARRRAAEAAVGLAAPAYAAAVARAPIATSSKSWSQVRAAEAAARRLRRQLRRDAERLLHPTERRAAEQLGAEAAERRWRLPQHVAGGAVAGTRNGSTPPRAPRRRRARCRRQRSPPYHRQALAGCPRATPRAPRASAGASVATGPARGDAAPTLRPAGRRRRRRIRVKKGTLGAEPRREAAGDKPAVGAGWVGRLWMQPTPPPPAPAGSPRTDRGRRSTRADRRRGCPSSMLVRNCAGCRRRCSTSSTSRPTHCARHAAHAQRDAPRLAWRAHLHARAGRCAAAVEGGFSALTLADVGLRVPGRGLLHHGQRQHAVELRSNVPGLARGLRGAGVVHHGVHQLGGSAHKN